MHRRTVLRGTTLLAVIGAAGCLGNGGAGEPEPTTEDSTEMDPTMTDATLTVTGAECGRQRDAATVSFEDETVTVAGTVWGRDASRTAALAGADYDPSADELALRVRTTERTDAGDVAAQCITEIGYEVTASFEGGLPGTVAVVHERDGATERVTTATSP